MPFNQVMPKFGAGMLHSGGPLGPRVTKPQQAVAIMEHEKQEAGTKPEYREKKGRPAIHAAVMSHIMNMLGK